MGNAMETVQSADGVLIAYEQTGSGPALILVTGAFNDRTSARPLAGALAADFTVYAFDRRGRGDSEDGDTYSIDREVADLAAVAAAAGGSPLIYGHSSGASIALEAVASGVAMRALAVYEPPYGTNSTVEFADEIQRLAATGQESAAAERFMRHAGTPAEVVEQMQTSPYWPRMEAFAPTLAYDIRLASAPIPGLGRVSVPVLALAGSASPAWARDAAAAIGAGAPDGRSVLLPDQAHAVAPDVLVPVLKEFFLG
jgi:pimeloyl-ACP methyl ester carboxylesterase